MRVKIFLTSLFILLLNVATIYAQSDTDPGGPCDFNDVDNVDCPLDTWVMLLAFFAIIFAAWHLHKRRKGISSLQKI
ncbi:MAG TPA: hypothetical protein VHA56_01270 [Mucilaginibacter sp.]|nr:hypothetical protein [Mucilaginibacter sp.]